MALLKDLLVQGISRFVGKVYCSGGFYGNLNGTATSVEKADLLSKVYPVGSIYMSVNSTSPASFLGGTWEMLQNRFLVGAGGSYSNGATGGEASHALKVGEIPAHLHTYYDTVFTENLTVATRGSFTDFDGQTVTEKVVKNGSSSVFKLTGSKSGADTDNETRSVLFRKTTGTDSASGSAHNNMPPYLAVYMWKRTK